MSQRKRKRLLLSAFLSVSWRSRSEARGTAPIPEEIERTIATTIPAAFRFKRLSLIWDRASDPDYDATLGFATSIITFETVFSPNVLLLFPSERASACFESVVGTMYVSTTQYVSRGLSYRSLGPPRPPPRLSRRAANLLRLR